MRLLPARARRAAPWKNGGGQTWQIAAAPAGSTLDDFDWRLSMAQVASDGPFSAFAGVDRVLAVVEGGPLVLSFADNGAAVTLDPTTPPFAFAGDRPVVGQAPGAPLIDLNLMTRRGRRRGAIERLWIDGPTTVGGEAETVVLALDAVDVGSHALGPRDALMLEPGETAMIRPHVAGAGVLMAVIRPAA